jgi:hypothetical protein
MGKRKRGEGTSATYKTVPGYSVHVPGCECPHMKAVREEVRGWALPGGRTPRYTLDKTGIRLLPDQPHLVVLLNIEHPTIQATGSDAPRRGITIVRRACVQAKLEGDGHYVLEAPRQRRSKPVCVEAYAADAHTLESEKAFCDACIRPRGVCVCVPCVSAGVGG